MKLPSAALPARSLASANFGFVVSGSESLLPFANRLTISTPALMKASPSPLLMAWNAIRVLCRLDEQ